MSVHCFLVAKLVKKLCVFVTLDHACARSRTNARKDSQSPKSRKKDTDRNIKITRVPDNSVKTDNKFASLTNSDQMEAEEYVDNTSSTNNNK